MGGIETDYSFIFKLHFINVYLLKIQLFPTTKVLTVFRIFLGNSRTAF